MSSGGALIAHSKEEEEEEQVISSLHVSSYSTSVNTAMATVTAISTAAVNQPTRPSFFSPQKRKRDASPLDAPETPWRLQYGLVRQQQGEEDDDQGEEKVEVEVEVGDEDEAPVLSGQVSPGSNKLASQLSDLNLSGKLIVGGGDFEMNTTTMITEEEGPAAKKVKRKGRAGMVNGKKKATVTMADTSTEDGDEDGGGRDIGLEIAGVGRKERNTENGNEKHILNDSAPRSRPRLRSPPLSKTKDSDASDNDGAATVDESDDADSDGPEQLGIGYRPTPTQRYVRSQKRMQQIKEYKARISKEAREKRSESRRRRRSFPSLYATTTATATTGPDAANGDEESARRKAVHFNLEPVIVKEMSEAAIMQDGLPQLPD